MGAVLLKRHRASKIRASRPVFWILCGLVYRPYHAASFWDVRIHAVPWNRKAPWPSWPHRRGFTGWAAPVGKYRV